MSLSPLVRRILPLLILAAGVIGFLILRATAPESPPMAVGERVWRVNTETVTPATLAPSLSLYGHVTTPRTANLRAAVEADVLETPGEEGRRVEAGQVLVRLETRELELQLAQAEANLAAADARWSQLKRGPAAEDLVAAQQNLASAQAAYDKLLHPDEDELTILKTDMEKAKALLAQAQAAYDKIGGDSNPAAPMTSQRAQLQLAWLDYQKAIAAYNVKVNPSNAQIQQALAVIQPARSQLARLPPQTEDLTAAQAGADASRAARDLAVERLNKARLVAPFAGTIASLDVRVGEIIGAGAPLLRLADLSAWQIETTDLTELYVVKIREGDAAIVTVDALPGLELPGKVARIKSYGENRQGDIVYTVIIKPDRHEERLRWNMTATVTIRPN